MTLRRHPSAMGRAAALALALLLAVDGAVAGPATVQGGGRPAPVVVARGIVDVDGGLIQIAAARDGVVREVLAEEGQAVKRDAVLARIDDRIPRVQAAVAAAELAQARAGLKPIELRLAAARREVARLEPLVAGKTAAAKLLDAQRDQVHAAEAELELQQAAVGLAEAKLQSAELEVEQRIVRAPLDGVVVRRLARPGDGISTLNVTTLFWLAPATPLLVRAEIEEQSAALVKAGQAVEIALEPDERQRFRGAVQRVGRAFAPRRTTVYDTRERSDVRVVEVVVAFDAGTAELLLGQRVIVRIETGGS
ncbi:HlyD family efflux transporter periplasmic adaptor subunit [Chelatococcus sp. SYSU_G07232]|uniref:HlyD family efflux transporter periplasmic adaptor subunit n=1 Tax=Chelatococcus albus TaxID=3047466 RepID=A0ABT7ABC5_9HYPH|nr:HlyD family efflux transporter periplasmic adaptor subunit [Chelatococcus sp. SYSU_G07232]MDJ1156665.1 HlyD family efflux transporter periplasmic adaptor subunit [Chelatococcus sp. SYSU_G07232]